MDITSSSLHDRLGNVSNADPMLVQDCEENSAIRTEVSDSQGTQLVQRCVIIQRDEKGYGLTVSGDNPVFVRSVRQDGAAAKAGVQRGDRIIKVNGTLVTQSNHQEVVKLIKSVPYVALILLGKPSPGSRLAPTPPPLSLTSNIHNYHGHSRSPSERITGPQPVNPEIQQEVENERIGTIRKMLEQELIFVENLKSELAKTPSDKLQAEMNGAAKRVKTLEDQLFNLTRVHQSISPSSCSPRSPPVRRYTHSEKENSRYSPITQHTRSLSHQISAPTLPKAEWNIISCSMPDDSVSTSEIQSKKGNGHVLNQAQKSLPLSCSLENISKQASSKGSSWPLQGSNHSRQSSNPDTLIHHIEDFIPSNRTPLSSPEFQNYNINNQHLSSRKCTASESFNEFEVGRRWKSTRLSKGSVSHADYTPPGTPPPDASSENVEYKDGCNGEDNTCFEEENFIESSIGSEEMAEGSEFNVSDNKPLLPDQKLSTPLSSPSQAHISPDMQSGNNTHGSSVRWSGQQPYIIGMEDDDFPSDTEMGQVEDHGPFKSMWSLMQNPAHLAVFIHYLMSNNDPSGLFFYVISDIYEQGTLKEMKKWAYEIHSSFLLPGAPLRIKNIDEAILNEIDDVLQHQLEKEEVIRAVFRKARTNAKKELKDLLADFRNKRALGLGNIYGPPDCQLELALHDKSKELKIIEQLLLPTVESIPEDLESASDKTLATASAVATILKQYGSKSTHVLNVTDRCPTFVSKEKGRLRILQRNKKVVFVQGHQFLPQHYHCVTYCNHCQLIIWGIGNQGYQCQNCEMNIHKYCVKIVEEHCIGTLRNKKDKKNYSVTGIVENIIGKTRKPSQPYPGAIERAKKINEEGLNADNTTTNTVSVVDVVTEPSEKATNTGRSERGSEDLSPPPAPISNLEVDILAKKATSIGRSESFRQRRENKPPFRKRSDPNIPRSKSDVEVDDKSTSNLNYSGSSSNSSLSARSLDSPCNSIEMVHRTPTSTPADALPGSGPTSGIIQPHIPTTISLDQYNDSDLEADVDPPNWQDNIDWDVIRLMKPKEKKRQDVINELFHTERTHVRNLKILDRLFYRPLQQEQLLPPDLLQLLFPNLEEMLEIHSGFNNKMKAKRREEPIIGDVGEMMLNMLDGESGENLMTAAAKFCRNQSVALENLKSRQKKDQKLSQFLADAEAQYICRRLQLKDIIATGFQRLTKYPLLLENVAKYTPANAVEYTNLLYAVDCSKRILAHVNQAVKEADNQHHLNELQRKLDKSAFDKVDNKITQLYKNLDLTKHQLLYDGHLTWRLNKQKTVEMHVVLFEDILVLLQKQDEKYILKFHNTNLMTGREDTKLTRSPILRVQNLFTRNVATDKSAFFLVSASDQHAIYEFVAASPSEKKLWLRYITEATEAYKSISNQTKHQQPSPLYPDRIPPSEGSIEEPTEIKDQEKDTNTREDNHSEKYDGIEANDLSELPEFSSSESSLPLPSSTSISTDYDTPQKESVPPAEDSKVVKNENSVIQGHIVQIVDSPRLIEPSEVVITESALLEVAEPVLTPMEQLRRKDQEIANALTEKQELVADILQIPKGEFEHFAEMANDLDGDKDAKELILAAIYQANKLTALVNDTFMCSEDSVSSSKTELVSSNESSETTASSSPQAEERISFPKLASPEKLKNISCTIDRQLTKLLGIVTEQEEERKQMRKELRCMQEQIHLLHEAHRRCSTRSQSPSNPSIYSRPSSFISIASSTSEGQCELLEPMQNLVLQETVASKEEEEKQDISTEDRETLDHEEMFVDAPSGECPILIQTCKVTDLDNEAETDENKSVNKTSSHDNDDQSSLPLNDANGKSDGKNNIAYF